MWNHGWNNIFRQNEWGRYPPEELVRFISRTYSKVADRKEVSILEVGCGPGANLWYLAREGYRVYGIDGSAVAIKRAKERLAEDGLVAEILRGDILRLAFPDEQFTCAIDIECIYANNLRDSRLILQEIKRVLKPRGLFFSKTFMTGTYGDGKGKLFLEEPHTYTELYKGALHKGYGIIRFTSEKDIAELYSMFEIVNIDYVIRSEKNRKYEIKEWLITCRKT